MRPILSREYYHEQDRQALDSLGAIPFTMGGAGPRGGNSAVDSAIINNKRGVSGMQKLFDEASGLLPDEIVFAAGSNFCPVCGAKQ